MITLNQIIQSQKVRTAKQFNKDLFKSEFEYLEDANTLGESIDTDTALLIDEIKDDRQHKIQFVAIGNESDIYLVNVKETYFNGEASASVSLQEITLQGFNFFTKDLNNNEDFERFYNCFLEQEQIQATAEELRSIAVLQVQFNNSSIIDFETDLFKYWVSFKEDGRLNKITKRVIETKPMTKAPQGSLIASILG